MRCGYNVLALQSVMVRSACFRCGYDVLTQSVIRYMSVSTIEYHENCVIVCQCNIPI